MIKVPLGELLSVVFYIREALGFVIAPNNICSNNE